jgi:hypothetical protein
MKVVTMLAGVAVLGGLALSASGAGAQMISQKPKVLLHVKAVTSKNQCVATGVTTCDQAVSVGTLNTNYHVQVLVAEWDSLNTQDTGIAGVQFGLDYMGGFNSSGDPNLAIDIFGWTLCATLEFASPSPAWPNPGSGNLITWDAVNACQRNNTATAGYFYLSAYMPATLKLIPRPADQVAKVADCGSAEIVLPTTDLGMAAFSAGGVTPGCNPCSMPCGMVAVQPTTWSSIKNLNH